MKFFLTRLFSHFLSPPCALQAQNSFFSIWFPCQQNLKLPRTKLSPLPCYTLSLKFKFPFILVLYSIKSPIFVLPQNKTGIGKRTQFTLSFLFQKHECLVRIHPNFRLSLFPCEVATFGGFAFNLCKTAMLSGHYSIIKTKSSHLRVYKGFGWQHHDKGGTNYSGNFTLTRVVWTPHPSKVVSIEPLVSLWYKKCLII